MGKKDPRVDGYIGRSADFARPILRRIRQAVHAGCPQVEEAIKWSVPHFVYGGRILCGTAGFKKHCMLIFWCRGLLDELKDLADGRKTLGGLRRIARIDDLPSTAVLKQIVQRAARLNEISRGPQAKKPPKRKIVVRVPSDLQASLAKNKQAQTTFEHLTPGRRREYVQWITRAKRDETRARRLKTAIEWLAQGKSFRWKYER